MSGKPTPIHQLVQSAIEKGHALEAKDIRVLRAQHKKSITLIKSIFWVGIAVFNMFLFVPLPFEINRKFAIVAAFLALLIAIVVPLLWLKKHQVSLELLQVSNQPLSKKNVNDVGRVYIDQVKRQDRPFVNVEFELLEGSKHSARAD
jgi:hypothetical protein